MSATSGSPEASDQPTRWPLIAAAAGGILLVAIVVAVLFTRDDDGTAGQSPASTASSATIPTSPQATGGTSPPASVDSAPTPSADAAAQIPQNWAQAAQFSEAGMRYVLGDLIAWSGGLMAVGTLYEDEARSVFGPPPPRAGHVWRSDDGTEWTDATPSGTFADVELTHLLETADGALIVLGDSWNGGPERTTAAWQSTDGVAWEAVTLDGLPDNAWVSRVASGSRGHLAIAIVGGEAVGLHSADGLSWEPTLTGESGIGDAGAGDEGFVATVTRGDSAAPTSAIVASSDGLAWFDATTPLEAALVAPRGSEWVALSTSFGETVEVASWGSADGLDWTRIADLALGSVDISDLTCQESPGALHGLPSLIVLGTTLAGPCSEGAVVGAGAAYASLDGAVWSELPFGEQAFAAGAAMAGERVVIGTDARTNTADHIGVTFWISETP